MAGMLPGVECARRRGFRKSVGSLDSPSLASHNSTRRSSFCLYASNHDSRLSSSFSLQRGMLYHAYPDDSMVEAAREARQRLDYKFRTQIASENKRHSSIKGVENRRTNSEELHTEIYGSKRSGSWRFSWSKLSWKASEQEDCAVCLESFRIGDALIPLPCAHRFHYRCLKPWLENNSHCPCCRTTIDYSL